MTQPTGHLDLYTTISLILTQQENKAHLDDLPASSELVYKLLLQASTHMTTAT